MTTTFDEDILTRYAQLKAELDKVNEASRKLQDEIQEARRAPSPERLAAIAEVNSLIAQFGLTKRELYPNGSIERYIGPYGEVWNGKGAMPDWMRRALRMGRRKADFRVGA